MHELSIALGIVDIAAAEALRQQARVVAIHVKVGAMSGVAPDALRSAFELAREQTPDLASVTLVIEEVPIVVYCARCVAEVEATFPELICRVCQGPTPKVLRGRELEVVALEVET